MASSISSLLGSAGIGGAIGKAIVSLELDTKKYQAELAAAEGQTKTSTTGMAGGFSKFGGLAKTALLGAGVAAVAFAAVSVKAAIEANEAHLKLTNTFKNNALLADSSVAAFEKQADALRDLTGVDDEAIVGAQALLGQFKLTGTEVTTLIPLIVDLSAKMGIDLEAAAKAVGKATQGSTGALSRYGIVLDKTALETDAFAATVQGLGVAQGFAAERADDEPWRLLAAQFEELEEAVGKVLLPLLQDGAKILQGLIPILKTVGEHLDVVVTILLGFAALKFLPGLLLSIASGFEAVGAAAIANRVLSVAAGIDSVGISLGLAVPPALAFAAAFGGITAALAAWDPLQLAGDTDKLRESMSIHDVVLGRVARSSNLVGESTTKFGAVLDNTTMNISDASQAAEVAQGQIGNLAHTTQRAAEEARRFGHMSKEAFGDFKEGVVESVQVTIGEYQHLKDAFDTTTKELRHQAHLAVEIARTEQRDLRTIFADKSLTDAQKEALAELPANLRHAWVEGGKASREQITQDAVDLKRLNERTFREIMAAAAKSAKTGGQAVGAALDQGTVTGIIEGSPAVLTAARKVIRDAINAAKEEAGAESPSKVMHELGLDMMEGLYIGITKGAQKVIDAARKSIEKTIDQIGSELDKVKGKAESFADSIRSGFSGFLDIAGGFAGQPAESAVGLSDFLAAQVSGATGLADVLKALKAQGASQATLGQVAGAGAGFGQLLLQGGPDLVAQMNDSLKTISDLANQTGKGLSEAFFGDKIDKLAGKLDRLHDDLRDLKELEREGNNIAIILEGQKVGELVRGQLIRNGSRNTDIFGGRA